ncbi:MAG: OB-fold nucleic acid binding domain-containing protein, partial [Candidatus Falkowbacteria bacterium]
IGYQTAYLKARWPTEFMAALLTADQQNTDRIAIEIDECRHMGIKVMAPDINQSFDSFTVVTSGTEKNMAVNPDEAPDTIRFGLKAVKNIGDHIAEEIIIERKKNGPYKDLTDLLERVCDKDLNKKSLESLIKSGGLDKFGERGQLLGNMDNILEFNRETTKNKSNGQVSLFFDAPSLNFSRKLKLEQAPAATQREKLAWEKELLGLYISEHPFSEFKQFLNKAVLSTARLAEHKSDYQVYVGGIITKIKKIITRSNEPMLFVKIEDTGGNVEILVFPSLLKDNHAIWQEGKAVLCQGKLSDKDQDLKLLCNKAVELKIETAGEAVKKFTQTPKNSVYGFAANGNAKNNYEPRKSFGYPSPKPPAMPISKYLIFKDDNLYINLNGHTGASALDKLKQVLLKNSGDKKVFFRLLSDANANLVETDFKVNYNKFLIEAINNILK